MSPSLTPTQISVALISAAANEINDQLQIAKVATGIIRGDESDENTGVETRAMALCDLKTSLTALEALAGEMLYYAQLKGGRQPWAQSFGFLVEKIRCNW